MGLGYRKPECPIPGRHCALPQVQAFQKDREEKATNYDRAHHCEYRSQ